MMGTQSYLTAAGTFYWTVPVGVTSIIATIVGAGGGGRGGGADAGVGFTGYGGASGNVGQARTGVVIAVTPGAQLTIRVGAGGAGGPGSVLSNTCGSASWSGGDGGYSGIGSTTASGGTKAASCNGVSRYGQNGYNGYGTYPYSGYGSGWAGFPGDQIPGAGGAFGSGYGAGGGGGGPKLAPGTGGSGGVGARGCVSFTYADPPPPPVAAFSGTPLSGFKPLTVQFTDSSTNTPTTWAWQFGDGETSAIKNPSHQYMNVGTYTVTLTAGNLGGSDAEVKTGYVVVDSSMLVKNTIARIIGT